MLGFTPGTPDEDRLTAAVFGLMRYLPPAEFAHPLLALLADGVGDLTWSAEQLPDRVEVRPWPTLEIPLGWQGRFKPGDGATKSTVTPDALIVAHWASWGLEGRPRTAWIYVEAEHSKAVEAEQLAQQWAVLGATHDPSDEVHLLLVNRTHRLPRPDSGRFKSWPAAPRTLAANDLLAWCAWRVQSIRTGATFDPAVPPLDTDRPRLLHVGWPGIAALVARRARQSWAYRPLFEGLVDYLDQARYSAPLPWLEVVALAPSEAIPDRRALLAGRRPELLDCDLGAPWAASTTTHPKTGHPISFPTGAPP